MPSFIRYQQNYKNIDSVGMQHKSQSESVMESTWDRDIATRTIYFYDYFRDDNKNQLDNLHPEKDNKKIPMRCKFIVSSSQTYSKDAITYHMQLLPSQKNVIPYYDELYKNIYGNQYPIGLYCDIEDSKGQYNKWLVVAGANYNDPQFPTFELLRCNYVVQYIYENQKYNISAVLRSQNSYNSGVWTDYMVTAPEDQQKFIVPLNRETEKLFYNQRLIIDANILTEPRTWQISKVNRVDVPGLCMITLAQTMFDEHKDYIELDDYGNVVGKWADYYSSAITPTESDTPEITVKRTEITYSGLQPQIRVGGGYKKFTVKYYTEDDEIPYEYGIWKYTINGKDVSSLLNILTYSVSSDLDENQIKIKFIGDDSYIGKVLTVSFESDTALTSSLDIELIGL